MAIITDDERGERLYMNVCAQRLPQYVQTLQQGRTSSDPLLSKFDTNIKADAEVLRALQTYCGTGRFILGGFDADGKCVERIVLGPLHAELIRRLMTVRPEPADIVALGCVTTKESLKFWTYRATGIIFTQSEIERIEISGAQIGYGITFSGTAVPGGLDIDATSMGRILEFTAKSSIGREGAPNKGLLISRSALEGSIHIRDTTFNASLNATGMKVDGSIEIFNSAFNANAQFDRSTVGGQVRLETVTGKGYLSLDLVGARSLSITKTTLAGHLYASLMRIDGNVDISGSTFGKSMYFNRLATRQFSMSDSRVGTDGDAQSGTLSLSAATPGTIAIEKATFTKQIFSGNTRVGAYDLSDVTTPSFDCTDCIIDQYLTLGGRFAREVRLWGAVIKSQLRLREGNACAKWGDGALLDLRGMQTRAIAADYGDLQIETADATAPAGAAVCATKTVRTRISGADFQQIMPGFRRPIVPEPAGSPQSAPTAPGACSSMPDTGSILDRPAGDILCWISNGLKTSDGAAADYDPRPYQLIASALETSGRSDTAVDVRIAKVVAEDRGLTKDFWYYLKKPFKGASYYVSGYGYHNEWGMGWFCILVAIGLLVFLVGRSPHSSGIPHIIKPDVFALLWYALWFSVDRAVPPLALDTTMSEYSILKSWARNYFYVHRALGTLIITIAIASLTGAFK